MTHRLVGTIPDWEFFLKFVELQKAGYVTIRAQTLESNCLSLNPSLACPSYGTLGRLLTSLIQRCYLFYLAVVRIK